MKIYNLEITEEGVKINNILINEKIFNKELFNYSVTDVETQIDNLINWISEAKDSDKNLMKEDLKYLMSFSNYCVLFSSISTNEYILIGDNKKRYDELCEELLKLNEGLK